MWDVEFATRRGDVDMLYLGTELAEDVELRGAEGERRVARLFLRPQLLRRRVSMVVHLLDTPARVVLKFIHPVLESISGTPTSV